MIGLLSVRRSTDPPREPLSSTAEGDRCQDEELEQQRRHHRDRVVEQVDRQREADVAGVDVRRRERSDGDVGGRSAQGEPQDEDRDERDGHRGRPGDDGLAGQQQVQVGVRDRGEQQRRGGHREHDAREHRRGALAQHAPAGQEPAERDDGAHRAECGDDGAHQGRRSASRDHGSRSSQDQRRAMSRPRWAGCRPDARRRRRSAAVSYMSWVWK